MTEREIFEKYDHLSENELKTKNKKEVYAKNDVMTTVIKRCRGEKKEAKEKIDDSKIWDGRMSRTQNKIKNRKNICKWKNTWRI